MAIRQITLDELSSLIIPAATRRIDEVVIHHSWSPTMQQYKGLATWTGIDRYHETGRGWTRRGPKGDELAIGYHWGIGADGSIWQLRDYRYSGCGVLNRNGHTLHICMIGNFDSEDPRKSMAAAAKVTWILLARFKLSTSAIRFHNEFASKTCPGTRVSLSEFRKLVAGTVTKPAMGAPAPTVPVQIVDHATGKVLAKYAMVEGGDHVSDQRKVYVKGGA